MKKIVSVVVLSITLGIMAFFLIPLEDDKEIRELDNRIHERKTQAAFEGSDMYDLIDCGDCCSVCNPLTYTAKLRWRRMLNQ